MCPVSIPSIEDVRKLRKKLGLTQSRLAELANVSQSLVSQIESGEVDPRLSTLNRIISALNQREATKDILAEDICTTELVFLTPQDLVTRAAGLMWTRKISQLPVLKGGKNVGSVSEKSITAEIAKGSPKNLAGRKIESIMQEPFPMISGQTTMDVVLTLLQDNLAVLVMDEGEISGIITKADVLTSLRDSEKG